MHNMLIQKLTLAQTVDRSIHSIKHIYLDMYNLIIYTHVTKNVIYIITHTWILAWCENNEVIVSKLKCTYNCDCIHHQHCLLFFAWTKIWGYFCLYCKIFLLTFTAILSWAILFFFLMSGVSNCVHALLPHQSWPILSQQLSCTTVLRKSRDLPQIQRNYLS